jgi:hypothetical protein
LNSRQAATSLTLRRATTPQQHRYVIPAAEQLPAERPLAAQTECCSVMTTRRFGRCCLAWW